MFRFQLIPQEKIQALLKEAADELHIKADEDALFWISKEATGSMRDAYTLFDQVASFSSDHITLQKIRERLNLAGFDKIKEIVSASLFNDSKAALEEISALLSSGVSTEQITKDGADFFRSLLLYKNGVRRSSLLGVEENEIPLDIVSLLSKEQIEAALRAFMNLYRDLRYTLSPQFELELLVSRLSSLPSLVSPETLVSKLEDMKKGIIEGSVVVKKKADRIVETSNRETIKKEEANVKEKESSPLPLAYTEAEQEREEKEIDSSLIPEIKENLSTNAKAILNPYLNQIEISKNGEWVLFTVKTVLVRDLLNNNRKELEIALEKTLGIKKPIKIVYNAPVVREKASEKMESLKAIFGGKINYIKEEIKEPIIEKQEIEENNESNRTSSNDEEFGSTETDDGEPDEEDV